MAVALKLENMTVSEKISAMESLWDDLCHHADAVKSPDWHGEILAEREKHFRNGKEKALSWDDAKSKILKACK